MVAIQQSGENYSCVDLDLRARLCKALTQVQYWKLLRRVSDMDTFQIELFIRDTLKWNSHT